YPPLHGPQFTKHQFNSRGPLPHVAGSPALRVLSVSLTSTRSSNPSCLVGLAGPASRPAKPLVSFQTYRQLSGWNPPPLMIRAFRAHCHFRTHAPQQTAGTVASLFNPLVRTAEQHGGAKCVILGEKMRGIQANAFSSALASRRSAVSKPSLNQP